MATVYNIKIKTVSAFVAYPDEYIEEMFKTFLKDYRDPNTNLGFESTEVEVGIPTFGTSDTSIKCTCGNILTEKEIFFQTCLQCDKTIPS